MKMGEISRRMDFDRERFSGYALFRYVSSQLKISATPTLIVLDQSKTVLGAWVGQLNSADEDKVLHLVRSGSL